MTPQEQYLQYEKFRNFKDYSQLKLASLHLLVIPLVSPSFFILDLGMAMASFASIGPYWEQKMEIIKPQFVTLV